MTPRTLASALVIGSLGSLAVPCVVVGGGVRDASAQTPPAPSPVEQARTHFTRGAELFKEGNFRAALVEFRRANEIAPNFRILYNLGQTYQELHDYVNALRAYEEYIDKGGAEIAADRRAEVEAEIRKLHGRVAQVTVKSDAEGAQLLVDDAPTGVTPLREPLLLSAGAHRLVLMRQGTSIAVTSVEVAGGDTVTVELKASPASAPPTPPVAPRAQVSSGLGAAFWVGVATTGALVVGTTVTGLIALDAKRDYSDKLGAFPGSRADVDAARDRTKHFALATDILGGAAILVGIGTVYLAVTAKGGEAPRNTPSVGLLIGPTSLGVQGSF
jgi:hypothetical protein